MAEALLKVRTITLGALGGTLNGDLCRLFGVIGVLPGYRGIQDLHVGYIRYWD